MGKPKLRGFAEIYSKVKKKKMKKAKMQREWAVKKEMPFVKPDDSLLQDISHRTVLDWLAVAPPSSTGRPVRLVQPEDPPGAFELSLEEKIVSGLREMIRPMEGGPFIKKSIMRRSLEGLASQILTNFVSAQPFREPKDSHLRKLAVEAAKLEWQADRIPDFKRLCLKYCAIYLRYNGNQLEEYLFLAMKREVERLKNGPMRSRRDINQRLEAAINLAYHQIASTLRALADFGQSYGPISDQGLMTVRGTMYTMEGNKGVYLTIMLDGEKRRDRCSILGLLPLNQFQATKRHSGDEPPTYCNCPAGLRQ
jgi:hypothetical protein